jgi:serine/threonine protein kinase
MRVPDWLSRLFKSRRAEPVEPAGMNDWRLQRLVTRGYEILWSLGEGGMGRVYLVKSPHDGLYYAVKFASSFGEAERRSFLAELQVWIGLESHPNLVPCHHFEAIGNDIAVFSEYLDAGSLEDRIHDRSLYRGSRKKVQKRILDIAIQSAWGLHAFHKQGLVHQDVKPGNVLLTTEVVVKITDFGLARARAAAGEREGGGAQRSILVSCGGMTPAYCSPEQQDRRRLSRQTDIWSWGLTVLEMYTGGVTWARGTAAREALESCLETGPSERYLPPMPAGVAEVLRRCFCLDPSDRWRSLSGVVQSLLEVYREIVGKDYPQKMPGELSELEEHEGPRGERNEREYYGPEPDVICDLSPAANGWLAKAFEAAGRDLDELESLRLSLGSDRQRKVAEYAAYREARMIFEGLVRDGRIDLKGQLASVCAEEALALKRCGDRRGALGLYNEAIEVWTSMAEQTRGRTHRKCLRDMAETYATLGGLLETSEAAVAAYIRSIEIWAQMAEQTHGEEHLDCLRHVAETYATVGNSLETLEAAVAAYTHSIEVWTRMAEETYGEEHARCLRDMAETYATMGKLLETSEAAITAYTRSIDILAELGGASGTLAVRKVRRAELVIGLAKRFSKGQLRDAPVFNWAVGLITGEIRGEMMLDGHDMLEQARTDLREALVYVRGNSEYSGRDIHALDLPEWFLLLP